MLKQSFAEYARQHRGPGARGPVKAGLAATLAATLCLGGQVALMVSYSQDDAAAGTLATSPVPLQAPARALA